MAKFLVWFFITGLSYFLTFSWPLLVVYVLFSQLSFWFKMGRLANQYLLIIIALKVLFILMFPYEQWLVWLWPLLNLLVLLFLSQSLINLVHHE